MWVYLGLGAALFLGFYDICKKHSVKENAVLPVLFLGTLFGSVLMIPTIILSPVFPDLAMSLDIYVPGIDFAAHIRLFIKSLIVSTSWVLSYFALKNLPISIVTPIKAAGPFFTLAGAFFLLGERPSVLQWSGLLLILISFVLFSRIGKKEGIIFKNNRWILFMILGTLAGSVSSLYDKYLIAHLGMAPQVVQAWFSVYLVVILGIVTAVFWFPKRADYTPFVWRWTIPLIGVLLIAADFMYFRALRYEGVLVVLLSAIKRGRVFVALIVGGLIFKEVNKRKKLLALCGILAGVFLIVYSSM